MDTTLARVGATLLLLAAPGVGQDSAEDRNYLLDYDPLTLSWAGDEVLVPMPTESGRSLVEVFVGDAGPFKFLIDTGSSLTVLDSSTAAALGLKTLDTTKVGAPGGAKVAANIVAAPRILIGDLTVSGAHPIVLGISEMTGGIIEGVLGMDLFAEVTLVLDPTDELATISHKKLDRGADGVVELDTSQGRWNFEINVAGLVVLAHIDTGSPGGFTLPIELLEKLPLRPGPGREGSVGLVGGTRKLSVRTLDGTIRLGQLEFENPEVSFMDPSPGAANLGSALFAKLELTIDQKSELIGFRESRSTGMRRSADAAPPSSSSRRLGVGFRGSPASGFTAVSSVAPGSLGEQAGFELGDKLLALNGRAMSDFETAELRQLIGGTKTLTWEVERDGQRLTLSVP